MVVLPHVKILINILNHFVILSTNVVNHPVIFRIFVYALHSCMRFDILINSMLALRVSLITLTCVFNRTWLRRRLKLAKTGIVYIII